MWEFANSQGDANGNMSYDEAKAWAESHAKANPSWTGNESFRIEDGKAKDTRSWITRNGWIFPVAAGVGVGAGALLSGGGAAGAAGAGTTGTGVSMPATINGLTTLPGTVSSVGTVGGASGAAGAAPSLFSGSPLSTTAAGNVMPATNSSLFGAPASATTSAGNYTNPGLFNGVFGATGGTSAAPAATGGSWIDRLLNQNTLQDLSRGIGSIAETQANNRGTELDAMMAADNMSLLFDRNERDSNEHLWKMLRAANYVKSGGKKPSGPQVVSGGRTVPTFNFGPSPISDEDKAVATTMEQQLMRRMTNPPQQRNYDSRMRPGRGESIMNWLGPIVGLASNFIGKK